ncbi:MAG: RsmD family RNA methyltransferase [Myxococcales bacterium]|nr:RsmD family RNA methyltransferase [Myxococcales bacterium]
MRIIAGRFGGRKLPGRPRSGTRPTTDRVREAVASVLAARSLIGGARVLDLFAGSGAVGLELLSRGAQVLVAVDRDVRALEHNVAALGVASEVRIVRADLWNAQASLVGRIQAVAGAQPFSLLFADPPYADLTRLPKLIGGLAGSVAPDAVLVVEHREGKPLPELPGWTVARSYRYGDTAIALLTAIA